MNVLPDFLYFAPKRQAVDKLARRVAPKRQIQNPPLVRRQFEGLTFLVNLIALSINSAGGKRFVVFISQVPVLPSIMDACYAKRRVCLNRSFPLS